jgi:hypothetical protein
LANGRPIDSPVTVTDNLTKAFTITTTESNATEAYNDSPATTQPYASIVYSKNGGIGSNSALLLQTNGQTNFALNGGGNAVQSFAPIQVTNAENNFLQVTPEAISFNGLASNAITIADGGQFGIGTSVDITPGVLAVYNASTNSEADLTPTRLLIGTYANTTSNITQDFSGQSLAGPSYTAVRPVFGGITWTTTGGTPADAGITKVNPALSSKAVTTSGAAFPGVNAQCAYLGNQYPAYPQPVGTYNGFILPTLTAAQPGESVTLSYAYAGGQSGKIFVNSILVQTIPPSSVWVSASTTFLSTGNDEVEFQVQTIPYTGNASQFNITNITFTYTVASVSVPQVSLASTGRNGSNYGILNLSSLSNDGTTVGSSITVGDSGNGITLTAPAVSVSSNMSFSNGGYLNFYSGPPTSMVLNGGTNQFLTIQNGAANIAMTGDALYFSATNGANFQTTNVYMNGSSLVMGSSASITMNGNDINGAGTLVVSNINNPSATLNIGYAGTTQVNMSNLGALSGKAGTTGAQITNCSILNFAPACGPATLFYNANFSGTKGVSMTLPPKPTLVGRNNVVFGTGYTSDSFTGSVGFTVPAYSVLSYSNTGSGTTTVYSNTNTYPFYYADTGFSPSSSAQQYSLVPIMT